MHHTEAKHIEKHKARKSHLGHLTKFCEPSQRVRIAGRVVPQRVRIAGRVVPQRVRIAGRVEPLVQMHAVQARNRFSSHTLCAENGDIYSISIC